MDNIVSETKSLPENETISESSENTIEDVSSKEILTQKSMDSDDEEILDEQSISNIDTSSDDLNG